MGSLAGAGNMVRVIYAFRQFVDFCRYVKQRFVADHCLGAAGSLAYTSLLALVPLFTIIFATLAAFPAFQEWRGDIESFIFRNFVPALGDQVRSYLVDFSDKARGLQTAGMIVLVMTVLAMMSTIESTFNVIWKIRRRRPLLVRILVYWAVLTLGPLLIGASIFVTSYLVSLTFLPSDAETLGLQTRLFASVPLFSTTLAFVMFFKLIPYRPVPFRDAFIGGLVAGVVFELAKRGFAVYVTQFTAQQAIYGAFATLPIFLLWIYLSWTIVLLGAEITQCLGTYKLISNRRRSSLYNNPVYATFRVLLRVYQGHLSGIPLSEKRLFACESDLAFDTITQALYRLDTANWISRDESYRWVLVRDLNRVTLVDLLQISPTIVEVEDVLDIESYGADEQFSRALRTYAAWLNRSMDTPIAELALELPSLDETDLPTIRMSH